MASNQYGGWGSTANAANVQPIDAFSRIMLMRYGGRTDNLFDYRDEPGYKREMGAAHLPGGGGSSRFQSSGMAETNFGKGNTPSNPGGYNWRTFQNNLDRMSTGINTAVNYRMENKRMAKARQDKMLQDNLQNFANNTLTTSQNLTAGLQAQSTKLVPGAAMPIGGRKNAPINLLGPVKGVPANPKQRNQNQTTKRKSTAPTINPPTAP